MWIIERAFLDKRQRPHDTPALDGMLEKVCVCVWGLSCKPLRALLCSVAIYWYLILWPTKKIFCVFSAWKMCRWTIGKKPCLLFKIELGFLRTLDMVKHNSFSTKIYSWNQTSNWKFRMWNAHFRMHADQPHTAPPHSPPIAFSCTARHLIFLLRFFTSARIWMIHSHNCLHDARCHLI